MNLPVRRDTLEKIKTVTLVVLIFITILLLSFFWSDFSFRDFSLEERKAETEPVPAEKVTVPGKIIFHLGEESYKVLEGKNWDPFARTLRKFLSEQVISTEEISGEQYAAAMVQEAARAVFDYPVSFSDFCKIYRIDKPQGADSVEQMSELGFSSASRESLLLADRRKGRYYRVLRAVPEEETEALFEKFRGEEAPASFPLSKYLGKESSNPALLPIALDVNLYDFKYRPEARPEDGQLITSAAKSFFGSGFDFIRKIEEGNGTIIYMYGYGQKVFIALPQGAFEYKEEKNPEAGADEGLPAALSRGLAFIADHGGFTSLSGSRFEPYLCRVEISGDKRKTYRFSFGVRVEEQKVFLDGGAPLVVEVTGNQVTYFRRHLFEYDAVQIRKNSQYKSEAFSPLNMLAKNYDYFTKELGMTGSFEQIADQIRRIDAGYVLTVSGGEEDDASEEFVARAVWAVVFDKGTAYFDLYTAEPVKNTEKGR